MSTLLYCYESPFKLDEEEQLFLLLAVDLRNYKNNSSWLDDEVKLSLS